MFTGIIEHQGRVAALRPTDVLAATGAHARAALILAASEAGGAGASGRVAAPRAVLRE